MRIAKITSPSGIAPKKERNKKEQSKSSGKPELKTELLNKINELNIILEAKKMPFRIVESIGEYYYVDEKNGEILGVLKTEYLDELWDNIKLKESEGEGKLTYDKKTRSGNFLDLDI